MSRMRRFNPINPEAGARMVRASDADEFATALLDIARSIAGIDELFGYIVVEGHEPRVLVSKSVLAGVAERVNLYVSRFYRHDPAVHAIRRIALGESFVQRISLASIIPHDYRAHCFTAPGFAEKLSFGWRGERYLIVISFYGAGTQDRDALGKLANLANLTLAVLVKQYTPINRRNVVETLETRLRRSFPSLSVREVQICARTIIGWKSARIATELGVSPGTILTYRQRAYQKTGVRSANDLVVSVLN